MGVFIPGVSAEPLTSRLSTDTEQPLLLGHYLDLTQQKVKMKIAAFNVLRLGWEKVNKKDVRDIIIEIMSQYSVVLLVEVTDKTDNRSNPYGKLCSEPLGPEGHKEKFKEVKIIEAYQYRGYDVDELTRQPFVLLLNCQNTVVQDLVLIPVHTKPTEAEAELNALHDVVEDVREKWKNDNIMILGDFNADGKYLSKEKKKTLRIFSARYHWLIDDDVDTTTCNNNDHTYDRMLEAIVPDSAKAYNFKEELKLTDEQVELKEEGCWSWSRWFREKGISI
ncbi:hypothetical protein F7725_016448 [Dissostichus mawsoni]|uniref:Deoxyribonuclease n=1 Tax=Dissostichus mawsoni TaxID=36200 RepID=A0A7J5Z1M5_DISMA|nr:hypothetical protein F7725_016448 [Dissostichus mawsoni]